MYARRMHVCLFVYVILYDINVVILLYYLSFHTMRVYTLYQASEALQHAYLHESPFPKQEALMPTFRTRHDDDNISGTSNVLGNKDKGGLGLGYRNISGNSNSNNSNIGQWKRQRR